MIHSEQVLAVIPARGGSKGLPRKNIRLVAGKPLIAWTIEAAHASKVIDKTILSSDDPEIIETARAYGCEVPFVRNPALAQDQTTTMDVVLDAIDRCPGFQWVVLLQPTSPLRGTSDIDQAFSWCLTHAAPACVSIAAAQESPYWMFHLSAKGTLAPLLPGQGITRRQDLPLSYSLNGAIYIARTDWLLTNKSFISDQTVGYVMPTERSLDIDTQLDLDQLTFLLEKSYVSLPAS